MNNEPGKYITEIKSADLKRKVDPNLSEAKGNKKIIIFEDSNWLKQSKRIENCSEKLDSNLTSTIEAKILPFSIPTGYNDDENSFIIDIPVDGLRQKSFQYWAVRLPIKLYGWGFRSLRDTCVPAYMGFGNLNS